MASDLRMEPLPPSLLAPTTSFVSNATTATTPTAGKRSRPNTGDARKTSFNAATTAANADEETLKAVEMILKKRIQTNDVVALFQLGQLYFEQGNYSKSLPLFEKASLKGDTQATFQLAVILYDGLVSGREDIRLGMKLMLKVAQCKDVDFETLVRAAQYNIGRAYYMGYGVRQNNEMAEQFWLLAASDGSPKGSVKAQTALGLFYTQEEQKDLKKSFFWHSEACGNGSLESQGALGVMHLTGALGKVNHDSAFICLREASDRGNVFAMGHMIAYYYKRKLYTKAVDLAVRVLEMNDIESISLATDCVQTFISKGIAMATFYYGRCCHNGHSVQKDATLARSLYSKAYAHCPEVTASLQCRVQHGDI